MIARTTGDPIAVRTCRACPFGHGVTCEHPDVPALVSDTDLFRNARAIEQALSAVDGVRPAWCPLNKRSIVVRAFRFSDALAAGVQTAAQPGDQPGDRKPTP